MPQLTNFPPSRRSFPLRGRGGKHTFRKGLRLAPDRLPRCVRQEHSEVAFGIDSDLRPNRFGCVTDVEVGSLVLADQIRARLLSEPNTPNSGLPVSEPMKADSLRLPLPSRSRKFGNSPGEDKYASSRVVPAASNCRNVGASPPDARKTVCRNLPAASRRSTEGRPSESNPTNTRR